jgi:hypothetical protein
LGAAVVLFAALLEPEPVGDRAIHRAAELFLLRGKAAHEYRLKFRAMRDFG